MESLQYTDSASSSSFCSKTSSDYWQTVEQKANEFLDSMKVFKGDPLMKQDRFFSQNKIISLRLKKGGSTQFDSAGSIKLTMNFKKKRSCIAFEKKASIDDEGLLDIKSSSDL